MNQQIRVLVAEKKTAPREVVDIWLRHPKRRQFIGGIVFDPSNENVPPDTLNLWQGFAVKPVPGVWKRMQQHIFEVICCGFQELYNYLLNYLARLVQYPAQQGEVAVVMKGVEGCGKGIVARALCHILGQHSLHVTHAKHLVGNFNAHLRDTAFLFADEAFFAGDKAHVGVLKGLITEPTLTIEGKGQNVIQTPNFLHIMMASNEQWVVPAGPEARRFFVLQVADTYARNRAYFRDIQNELEAGGYEAMLYDLLNHDISDFDVRDVPYTEGLQEQKKLSLGTSEAWWMDVLHRGYVWKSKHGLEEYFGEWHEMVTTEVLFTAYSEFAKNRNERHPMGREALGTFMVKMGCKSAKKRNGVVGEHFVDVPIDQSGNNTKRQAELIRKKSLATGYHAGSLAAARTAFETVMKLAVQWEGEADADQEGE